MAVQVKVSVLWGGRVSGFVDEDFRDGGRRRPSAGPAYPKCEFSGSSRAMKKIPREKNISWASCVQIRWVLTQKRTQEKLFACQSYGDSVLRAT